VALAIRHGLALLVFENDNLGWWYR